MEKLVKQAADSLNTVNCDNLHMNDSIKEAKDSLILRVGIWMESNSPALW